MLTVGSLFSGIGGFDLGLERAGMRVLWQCESDEQCRRVLREQWPDLPTHVDVRDIGRHGWFQIVCDVLCGGFPCQDISSAHTNGARRGLGGQRSGLWSEFDRIVGEILPGWVIVENVDGWRRWVPAVRADLARHGYASVPLELRASDFGAWHQRPRVWVVAHANGEGEPLRALHAQVARLRPVSGTRGDWRSPPSGVFRMDDGVPRGMDRLRQCGNACLPQIAEWIGRRIVAYDEEGGLAP